MLDSASDSGTDDRFDHHTARARDSVPARSVRRAPARSGHSRPEAEPSTRAGPETARFRDTDQHGGVLDLTVGARRSRCLCVCARGGVFEAGRFGGAPAEGLQGEVLQDHERARAELTHLARAAHVGAGRAGRWCVESTGMRAHARAAVAGCGTFGSWPMCRALGTRTVSVFWRDVSDTASLMKTDTSSTRFSFTNRLPLSVSYLKTARRGRVRSDCWMDQVLGSHPRFRSNVSPAFRSFLLARPCKL